LARWADRGNRVTIITLTTALWSAALAISGLAGNFLQLLLIRISVAVGEAGCVPPAQSLIADHFTRAERPRATAIYMLGVPLSAVIGYFVAGWLNELYGWRMTFVFLGLPGLGLAVLAKLTLREPRRLEPVPAAAGAEFPSVGLLQVIKILWSNISFRHVLFCWSMVSFFGTGIWQWKPAFFIRTYGLQTSEVGTWFAIIYGVCALVGLYLGGELASRHAANNERLQFRCIAVAYCIFGAVQGVMFLSPNQYLAFALLAVSTVGIYTAHGPLFAAIQSLVAPSMRAMAVAIIYLFANLIGLGLGPLTAGALSDELMPRFGDHSLRYALTILCAGYLWAAWHLWQASRTVIRDLEAMQRSTGQDQRSASSGSPESRAGAQAEAPYLRTALAASPPDKS
ncbi:MAG: spinster family MFS transporter, partial [Steroidobacteraceae bacterium]